MPKWFDELRRDWLVPLAALATLGSGIVNVFSVIGRALPERRHILRELFPLEFIGISRSLTLLIGFALIVLSLNVLKRKERAFQGAFVLACCSVVFHMTKGIDYEEAAFSLLLVVLLAIERPRFTVKSRTPDFREGFHRFVLAFGIAFAYGVAGLWLLEPREFGVDFHIGDAIHRTLLILSLVGDPGLAPQTRYARWFVDSLHLITLTAFVYSAVSIFRPVVYLFATHPLERAEAAGISEVHGRSSMEYFKLWPDKSFFFSRTRRCFLSYSVAGSFAVGFGDPVGPEEEIEGIVFDFSRYCRDNGWNVGFHQVGAEFLPVYRKLGFKRLKIGDEAIVDVRAFTLDGKNMKPIRNAVTKIQKQGVKSRVVFPPIPDELIDRIETVSEEWLTIPGRRERGFTVGRFDPHYVRSTPVMIVTDPAGDVLAFANILPPYRKDEISIDLMRRRTEAPNGIMEYLFTELIRHARESGYARFNLGLSPMSGFREKEQASPEERAVHAFFQRLNFLFSYKGLRAYKAKFASSWEPRYVVYSNVLQLPRLALALGKLSELKD